MVKLSKFEVIRFDKDRSTSIHIAFYDNELVAKTVADAMNALDQNEQYGKAVVLEPRVIVPRLSISSQVHFCCEKCDQPV